MLNRKCDREDNRISEKGKKTQLKIQSMNKRLEELENEIEAVESLIESTRVTLEDESRNKIGRDWDGKGSTRQSIIDNKYKCAKLRKEKEEIELIIERLTNGTEDENYLSSVEQIQRRILSERKRIDELKERIALTGAEIEELSTSSKGSARQSMINYKYRCAQLKNEKEEAEQALEELLQKLAKLGGAELKSLT